MPILQNSFEQQTPLFLSVGEACRYSGERFAGRSESKEEPEQSDSPEITNCIGLQPALG